MPCFVLFLLLLFDFSFSFVLTDGFMYTKISSEPIFCFRCSVAVYVHLIHSWRGHRAKVYLAGEATGAGTIFAVNGQIAWIGIRCLCNDCEYVDDVVRGSQKAL